MILFSGLIRLSQLLSLGITKEQLYFIFIFIGIVVSYYIVQPFIHWFVTLQSTKILSYLITSLLVLFVISVFRSQQPEASMASLMRVTLQSLAAFGCVLFIVRIFQALFKKGNKKSV